MAKATTRKKTKTSGRKTGAGKRAGSARKSASSRAGTPAGKSRKAKAKARKTAPKKKTAKKKTSRKAATRKTTKKTSARRTAKTAKKTTRKKSQSKKAARKKTSRSSARKTVKKKPAKKKAAPKRKTASTTTSAAKKAPDKTEAAKKSPVKTKAGKAGEAGEAATKAPASVLPSVEDALAQLPYNEGQFVVHPKYGLGMVDRVTERKLSTRTVPCLEISFSYQEMRLTIPVDQVGRSGLRRPISRRQIDEVFKALKGRATFDAKRRSAKRVVDYRKRLNQGDPISLAEAIRDLGRLSLKKSLSYEERKILSTALRILSREVALARGREPDDVREEIEKIVYR